MTDIVVGTFASENLSGGSGVDIIYGGGGDDRINGGSGNDVLNGGAGSDRVSGGSGSDTLIYVAANNAGATDIYDGGSGIDVLALVFTRAEWMSAAVQGDVARYLAFVARETHARNGQASNAEFRFSAFDLRVSKIEAFVVVVDGVLLDLRDAGVALAADALTATEDAASVAVDLLANDRVPDLVRTVTHTQGANGAVAVVLDMSGKAAVAQAVYTPDAVYWQSLAAGETGTDSFTYTVTDADGDVSTQTVTVTITGTNDAPVASVDATAGTENQALVIDVLANDADVDKGAVLTLVSAAAPDGRGTASVDGSRVAFAPGADFDHLKAGATETVVVSYSIRDEHGATASSTVTITVTGTNDGPVVTSITDAASGSVIEAGSADDGAELAGVPATTGSLTSADVDDGATAIWSGTADGALGGFAISASGVWTYTLDQARAASLAEGETRTEIFTATVTDDFGATATQVVTVTVAGTNDAPVVTSTAASGAVVEAGNADDGAVVAGTPTATGMLTASDADTGARLVWSGSADGIYGGFAVGADGAWTYTLANASDAVQALGEGETRTETFTATVTDEFGARATQVVTITVTGANDAPVVTSDVAAATGAVVEAGIAPDGTTGVGTPSATGTLTSSDLDAGATATWSGGGAGTFGALAITAAGVWTYTLADASGATQALGAGETRTETFTALVADAQGAKATQIITIAITGSNDAPTIVRAATSASGAVVQGPTQSASGRIAFADPDANDTHQASVTPRGADGIGALTLGAVDQADDSVGWTFAAADGAFDFLAAGETRTQVYDVAIADGQGDTATQVVSVTITGANDAPTIVVSQTSAAAAITEGGSGSHAASGSIAFADIDAIDLHAASVAAEGERYLGALTLGDVDQAGDRVGWSFAVSDAALDSLAAGDTRVQTYLVSIADGQGGVAQQRVTVTITGTNDAPVVTGAVTGSAIEDGAVSTLNALANASDVDDGAKLEVRDIPGTLPAGVTFDAATQSFALDPRAYQSLAAGRSVTVSVAYGVSDGAITVPASVSWTLTGTNDAPVVTGTEMGAAIEDGAASTLNALANASDVDDGAALSVRDVPSTLPAGVSFDAAARTFTLDPAAYGSLAAGQVVTVSVAYTVSDGTATTPASVSWTVTGTNDAPVVAGAVVGAATEDGAVSTLNALGNASDVDNGATLIVRDVPADLPRGVTFDPAARSFTLDPAAYQSLAAGQSVSVSVAYGVSDGTATTPASVGWTVTGTNDAPVVSGAVVGAAIEDGAVSTLNALANASDVDAGAALSVVNIPDPLPAGVSYDAVARAFALDPAAYQALAGGDVATVTVRYGVSDGTAVTPASATWTVTGANDAPVVTGAVVGVAGEGGATSTLSALANASDADAGATLRVVDVPALPKGVTYDAATRAFTLDPSFYGSLAAGETATIVVDYGVSDGIATTAASVRWTIAGANGAPVVTGAVTGTAAEDGAVSTLAALANASDGDTGTVLRVVDVPVTLPAGVSYDPATRSFTLDPAAYQSLANGQTMVVAVAYGVSDGLATTPASATWTVTGTNDAPVVTASDNGAVKEDVAVGADGQVGATGVIAYADPDARGTTTVAVAGVPDNYLGTFAAALAADGRVTWSFTADNAKLQSLRGSQTLVQDYRVTIDDGQGGSVVQTVSVTIGGTNDDIVRGETVELRDFDVDGVTVTETRFYFTDVDIGDVHSGTAMKRVADSFGTISGSAIGQEADGRFYIDVEYRHVIAEIRATPADLLDWRYQVRISDNAGDEVVINRIVTFSGVEYYIGGEGNDDIGLPAVQRSVLIGGGGSDRLTGGTRDDSLFGDEGPGLPSNVDNGQDGTGYAGNSFDDLLNGHGGADRLTGGGGADVFEFNLGEADGDVVLDFSSGEGDTLRFEGWGAGATFTQVDATRWELANGDRSVVEIITFSNAPAIVGSDYLFT